MRIKVTQDLISALLESRVFTRPKFEFGDIVGKVVNVTNRVTAEAYSRIPEAALSWDAPVCIGAFSYISPGGVLPGCDIGRYTSIATGVRLMGANHPTDRISTSTWSYGDRVKDIVLRDFGVAITQSRKMPPAKRTKIQNDVWIGEFATLKRGVTLAGC